MPQGGKSGEKMAGDRIELSNVSKEYHIDRSVSKKALSNITLDIEQGEYLGVIGQNGSGKTTMARLLNGLILPTTGRVLVGGMDTADSRNLQEIRRQVGMVFQNPDNQIVSSIVEEDVAFGPENLGLAPEAVRERTDWALQALGLEDLRFQAPHLLSGGQKQRVAVASALAMQSRCLVLDEPASMLDQSGRRLLLETLDRLNKEHGLTIVLISHNMEDVVRADRLIVLNEGSIRLTGSPREVFADDRLEQFGLEPPDVIRMANHLGLDSQGIESVDVIVRQLVERLCQL
jgi:energy-coupling factor transport system ATP-binding protein